LKSLEAVFKEITSGESVFSHVLISPKDVFKIFGEEFVENESHPERRKPVLWLLVNTKDCRFWIIQEAVRNVNIPA